MGKDEKRETVMNIKTDHQRIDGLKDPLPTKNPELGLYTVQNGAITGSASAGGFNVTSIN